MAALQSGLRLGPYEVLAPLGAGGMGEVYKARDTRLDREVAIKVLPQHLASTPELRARFDREARAISALNHPHICVLYDVGHQEGVDYLVMEHLEGETLAARLEREPLPTEELLKRAAEIADALDKAHRQGMAHRDLKPGNVMLTRSGAKLLDFGLARAMTPAGGASGVASGPAFLSQTPTMSQPLTAQGSIVGTFQYMAPEQLEGKEADARSDIWAFGATLYEMATGKKAFEGHSHASLIASILKEQPRPIAELQPLTPPGLDRIVQRCLAKDPEDRWQSARDLAHELKWIAEGGSRAGVPAPVSARRRGREQAVAAVAILSTLGVLGFAIEKLVRRPAPPDVVRFRLDAPTTLQFADAPRVSPNGRLVAFSAADSTGVSRIWVRALNDLVAKPLPGTEGTTRPFWSPDSRYLAFFAGGKLRKIEVAGGPPVTICDAPTGADGSWGTRNVILYDGQANDPLMRVPAAGGVPTVAVAADSATSSQPGWPEFLPDGRHFLFQSLMPGNNRLCVGTLDSKETRDLAPCDTRAEFAQGYVLFARGNTLLAQRFDAGSLKLGGEPVPVAEPVRAAPNGGADFSTSESGVLTYAAGGLQNGQFLWVDRAGRPTGTAGEPGNMLNPALSPDGRRLAFRVQDQQTRTRDVWLIDLARGTTTRFTFEAGNENDPVWSPDGARIVYSSDSPGTAGLYVKGASGAGAAEALYQVATPVIPTDWSRDGRYIVFETNPPISRNDVWVLPTFGDRKPFPFVNGQFNEGQGQFSPDGRWLAYTSDESGRREIYVQSFPERGGKWQVSVAGGSDPRWRADGRELFFMAPDQRMMAVAIHAGGSFEADVPQVLFQAAVLFPGPGVRTHYAVSPDAQRFLLAAPLASAAASQTYVVLNWAAELERK